MEGFKIKQQSSPLYRQIANLIKDEILKGNIVKGEAIPTEKKLSEQYGASRVTIRQAIDLLVSEGLLYKVQGSGTYVKDDKIEHNIYRLRGFTEEMIELNKKPVNKILNFTLLQPDERVRNILQLEEGEATFYIRRQRFVDDIPVVVEDTYMPVSLFPDLSYEVMQKSKYDYIEQVRNFKIKESFQEVLPLLPEAKIQELLQVGDLVPILKVQLWSTLVEGTVFEYSELYFKSDEYKFTIMASRS